MNADAPDSIPSNLLTKDNTWIPKRASKLRDTKIRASVDSPAKPILPDLYQVKSL